MTKIRIKMNSALIWCCFLLDWFYYNRNVLDCFQCPLGVASVQPQTSNRAFLKKFSS